MTELDVYKPPFEQLNKRRLAELEALCLTPFGPNDLPLIASLDHSRIKSETEGRGRQFGLSGEAREIARASTRVESTSFPLLSELYEVENPTELEHLLYADMHGWATMRQQAKYYPNNHQADAFDLDRRYLRDALLGEPLHPSNPEKGLYISHVMGEYREHFDSVENRLATGMKREMQLIGTALLLNPDRHHGELPGLKTELGLSDDEVRTVFTLAMSMYSGPFNSGATARFYDIALSHEPLQKVLLDSDKPELQKLADGDLVTEYSLRAFVDVLERGSEFHVEKWDRLIAYYGTEAMELVLPLELRAEIVMDTYTAWIEKSGRIVEPHYHDSILQVLDTNTVAELLDAELAEWIAHPWAHLEDKWPSEFDYSFFAHRIEKQYGIDLNLGDLRLHDLHTRFRLEALQKFAPPSSELAEKSKALKERADAYDPVLLGLIEQYCSIAAKGCFEYADPAYGERVRYYEEDVPWINEQIAEAESHQASLDVLAIEMKLRLKELSAQS